MSNTASFVSTSKPRDRNLLLIALVLRDSEADIHAPLFGGLGLVEEVVDPIDRDLCRDVLPGRGVVEGIVTRLDLSDRSFNVPCGSDEDLRRPGVGFLRLGELEGDDRLLLGEVPNPHARREVAVHGLDAELVRPVREGEPILAGELDRLLLAERRLIAADLLVVDELGDDHVVALDVGDGVLLGEAARLLAEIFVLSRDSRGRVRPLEGEAAVGRAALAVAGRDDEIVDRIEAQGVELFRSDRDGELLTLRGIVDGAENLVVQLFDDRDFVAVRVVDGVVVGEADVLVSEVGVRAGNGRGGIDSGECPCPGSGAALAVRYDNLDRVTPEGVLSDVDRDGVFCFSRRGERLRRSFIFWVFWAFGVGATDLVVRPSIDSVAARTSPESASSTVYSIVKFWFLSPRLRSLSEIRGSVFRISRTGRKPTLVSRWPDER